MGPHWLTEEEEKELGEPQSIMLFLGDPTVKLNGKWYFYDETRSRIKGPYDTREKCREGCEEYSRSL